MSPFFVLHNHHTHIRKEPTFMHRYQQYRYYCVDDESPRFLLAESLSDAIYTAAELCGGTNQLKDIILDDHEW